MKIFLDVGAHIGQTVEEVIRPEHGFDTIHAFEPSSIAFQTLSPYQSNQVVLHPFGLSNRTGSVVLYDTGTDAASVYQDKVDLIYRNHVETIQLQEASEWIIKHTQPDDIIYMKLNCEGSECDIIENLIQTGVYDRISHIMIDFDVRKIPSQSHRQHEILTMLHGKRNFHISNDVMIGPTHQDRTRNWLSVCSKVS
jgi:FkbM family methyltransferase